MAMMKGRSGNFYRGMSDRLAEGEANGYATGAARARDSPFTPHAPRACFSPAAP